MSMTVFSSICIVIIIHYQVCYYWCQNCCKLQLSLLGSTTVIVGIIIIGIVFCHCYVNIMLSTPCYYHHYYLNENTWCAHDDKVYWHHIHWLLPITSASHSTKSNTVPLRQMWWTQTGITKDILSTGCKPRGSHVGHHTYCWETRLPSSKLVDGWCQVGMSCTYTLIYSLFDSVFPAVASVVVQAQLRQGAFRFES